MKEAVLQTQDQWSYGLLKNEVRIAPDDVRSSLEIGDKEGVLIRVQGVSVAMFMGGEPFKLAPYLVYTSPNIAGTIEVREYEGVIGGSYFRIYCFDADTDIDLIQPDGTVWRGICRYREEEMS